MRTKTCPFSRAAPAAQAVYWLLAAVYFLWPFPKPPRRRRLSTGYLLLSTSRVFLSMFLRASEGAQIPHIEKIAGPPRDNGPAAMLEKQGYYRI